ncbi:beta-glucan synthesis-associated protein [Vermiconidia calcicola]|uniref:Beta-glucan synthesis-associated protein n=1 Tax=Vermiconidia calcicola TaxID=1690605 RepID=A0ACC3N0E1_9PEZI|nr:beta-glucan synthesis-associated protein [Vermiconidia calcicola]
MAPSRPAASRSSSGHAETFPDPTGELQAGQAGRSPINLAAQQSVQSFREASRPVNRPQNPWRSTPNLPRKKSRPSLPQVNTENEPLRSQDGPSTRRTWSHMPSFVYPFNSSSAMSTAGTDSRRSSIASTESLFPPDTGHEYRNNRYLTVPVRTNIPRRDRPALVIPGLEPEPHPMARLNSPASFPSLSRPRSVRELGTDYTRYFNPFATAHSSQQDLSRKDSSSHLMAGALDGVAAEELGKRLSNPFDDSKRLSNPFESAESLPLPTPQPMQVTPVDEVHPAVATLALHPRTGTPTFVRNADQEKATFFQYMDDRLGAPGYSFPLITDDKEDDDDMHMPQWDDDIRLKPRLRDHFTRENIVSTLGLIFMVVGLLCIFVVLPIISYTGTSLIDYYYQTPLDQMPGYGGDYDPWYHVNDREYPLLQNIRSGLIDPDTPTDAMTRVGVNGETLVLVFSDEFERKNRTFYPGDDPYWTGFEGWYGATQDLEWYDPDAIDTGGGTLMIQLDQFKNHNLDFRSGMLNSWNQLCLKGGIFEVSMSLPGPAGKHGLWPGVWTMGNLGRPGYLSTTDGLWPYTYNECDAGITKNQSMTDGTSNLPGQRLASCTCAGEDHPSPGRGRGAPEIDIAEVSGDWSSFGLGVATQSFQVAPFDVWYYPNYEFMENPNRQFSFVNTYTGGPFQEAVSTTSMLNNTWYDGEQYQSFAFEYAPGDDENAFIAWTIGDLEMMKFDGRAIGPNGNVGQRLVSEEPMAMIMNLGISHSWVDVQFQDLRFPTIMRIDYVRWYQREQDRMVTCDPPGYETTEYIAKHPAAYRNSNFTTWEDTGYSWPRNTLVDGCST